MEDYKSMGINELVKLKDSVSEILSNFTIQINNGLDVDLPTLRAYQAKKHSIIKAIDEFFDDLHGGNDGGFFYMENIFERERAKLTTDEDGKPIMDVVRTGIKPIDEYLFSDTNNGIPIGSYVAIVGESNVGKSDIIYMMISGFLSNNEKVHLHSFELGWTELYNTLSKEQKHKLKTDVETDYKKMLSVDTSKEISSIIRTIRIRFIDGCRIFVIDSLSKITRNGNIDDYEMNSTDLREIANELGIVIIVLAQKSIGSIKDDSYIVYGSVMLLHHFNTAIFIEFENKKDRTTSERMFWLEKHRLSRKKGMITDFDSKTHSLKFVRESNGVKVEKTEKEKKLQEKAESWASKLR